MFRTATNGLRLAMLAGILGLLQANGPATASAWSAVSAKKESTGEESRSKDKARPIRNRLPKYFAQLKLDDQQRQQILEVQERFAGQLNAKQELLDETRKELDQLRKDQERDYNRILKTSQRRRLKELRNRSKRSAETKAKRK